MELVEKKHTGAFGMFFEEWQFDLVDNGKKVCNLMAMVTVPYNELDLSIFTLPEYYKCGYATEGVKMLILWGVKNGYKTVRLTNISGSIAINKIATKLGFTRKSATVWTKSIVGPLRV